jgi:hypothetical protein
MSVPDSAPGLTPNSSTGYSRSPALRNLRDAATMLAAFFIVDGDLTMYLIPSQVIAGRVQILLRTCTKYIVSNAAGLMAPRPNAA